MRLIGFLVNPVAGMGGAVGLKGTDGNVDEAVRRGAVPHAAERAALAIRPLAGDRDLFFLTCSGAMGEDVLNVCGISAYRVVYDCSGTSTADDTKNAVAALQKEGAGLVLFCGGDGTARDIFSVIGRDLPMLGIPAGVKMYSAVFAIDPAAAAGLVRGPSEIVDRDVMDVDEEAYRAGSLETRLYGVARVPARPGMVQAAKQVYEERDEERAKQEIARFIAEVMVPGTLYILGAGTTTEAIARELGVSKTLLGVDAVIDRRLVAADADARALMELAARHEKVRIIVSPIGAQGFILGRGSQQISAGVVRRAGISGVIVVATPHKLRETPVLYADTGDRGLDAAFGDSIQVISGYRIAQRKKLRHGS